MTKFTAATVVYVKATDAVCNPDGFIAFGEAAIQAMPNGDSKLNLDNCLQELDLPSLHDAGAADNFYIFTEDPLSRKRNAALVKAENGDQPLAAEADIAVVNFGKLVLFDLIVSINADHFQTDESLVALSKAILAVDSDQYIEDFCNSVTLLLTGSGVKIPLKLNYPDYSKPVSQLFSEFNFTGNCVITGADSYNEVYETVSPASIPQYPLEVYKSLVAVNRDVSESYKKFAKHFYSLKD